MNILRKFLVFLAYTLLPAALITFGALFSIHQAFGSAGTIKSALNQSGVYNDLAASVVQQAATANGGTIGNDQQAVQKAVSDAVSPAYLQKETNSVLDGIYAWIQGKTTDLSFNVDLTPIKGNLVNSVAEQAKLHAQSLPACTDLASASAAASDPFSATCLPPGVTPDAVAEQARQQVLSSDAFKTSSITPQTISQNQGHSLQEQLKPAATAYAAMRNGLWVAGVTALILIAAVIGLSKPWQGGVKRVAWVFIPIGAVNVLLGFAAGWVTKFAVNKLNEQSANALQAKIANVVKILSDDLRHWWIGYGIVLIVLGIAGLVAIRIWRAKQPEPRHDFDPSSPEPPTSPTAGEPPTSDNNHPGAIVN